MKTYSQLEPYQQRVVDELLELEEKLSKLEAFLDTADFSGLPNKERGLLNSQLEVMLNYKRILELRIQRFQPI